MLAELDDLIADTTKLTGAAPPPWLDEFAPSSGNSEAEPAFYLVGLIGGKDVGKTALVNALVGQQLNEPTAFGPGTEMVVAYVHADCAVPLRELLEREVPGRFQIIEHRISDWSRQVLLDLPDIDSHWGDHLTITRAMLRHMLYPIWVQSVEKYADQQPQKLLARVAAGNAPGNFLFCLNKVDQLNGDDAASAIVQLRDDYAGRLARVLDLPSPPQVWAVAAKEPERFDLPQLREVLSQQKSSDEVQAARAQAKLRQKISVLHWLDEQDLAGRTARLQRLETEYDDLISQRLGEPLLEEMLPRILEEAEYHWAMTEDCMARRVAHWPIVNILHPLLTAIARIFSRGTNSKTHLLTLPTPQTVIDEQLAKTIGDRPLSDALQTTFALLQQRHPMLGDLYHDQKLWEATPAQLSADTLRRSLITTVDHQRQAACQPTDRSGSLLSAWRGLLTVGALIWFPFVQPILEVFMFNQSANPPSGQQGGPSIGLLLVRTLSITNLLSTLTFFAIYYSILWLILRWDTQRRIAQQFTRWQRADGDSDQNLAARVVDWLDELVQPIRKVRQETSDLADRIECLRKSTLPLHV